MRGVVVAITLLVSTASADPEKAKQLSAEAEAFVTSGDLASAAAKYRAAYKEEPVPEHICNAGVAYHKLKDLPRSHRYLNQCVTMGSSLDPAYRDNLRRVVEAIEQKLVAGDFAPVDIALKPATATVSIEGGKTYDEDIVGGGRIWLPFGTYRLIVRADGYVEKQPDVVVKGHDAMPLVVTLDKTPEPTKPIVKPVISAARPHPKKLPAIIATGAAGAIGIVGLVFYAQARGNMSDAESTKITFDEYEDFLDKAHSKRQLAVGFGIGAGVVGAVAGLLWWRALRDPGHMEVTATGNTVGIAGRF